ncbi:MULTISPECIES: hypothetical protein [Marinobacter]|uniref:hypothetical protein n=1 Tax=Marinobacter TaxID=2742 RepID=UPI0011BE1608|nr:MULTISPECIES: hypothetical protein [Marinobacter]MCG8523111.1 hypothetical protein [Pseudomonadales bacterium]MBY5960945.1 hypothetical protein [Marinobacter nauticus]MBY6104336.1 hypothetical protein [Marinobacter nauticus]MBY6192517.1 hypothetical protein [Marinobacter nauticus]MBY6213665.1 hypothetical protein [Marinobacter nauticus]
MSQRPCWLVIPDNAHSTEDEISENRTSARRFVRDIPQSCELYGEPEFIVFRVFLRAIYCLKISALPDGAVGFACSAPIEGGGLAEAPD